jgi:hypothetical protein
MSCACACVCMCVCVCCRVWSPRPTDVSRWQCAWSSQSNSTNHLVKPGTYILSYFLGAIWNVTVRTCSQDAVLEFADRAWSIPKKEVLSSTTVPIPPLHIDAHLLQIMDAEFGAFMHLNFSLHIPHEHIYIMYTRLLKQLHKTSRVYLGEERFSEYTKVRRTACQLNVHAINKRLCYMCSAWWILSKIKTKIKTLVVRYLSTAASKTSNCLNNKL